MLLYIFITFVIHPPTIEFDLQQARSYNIVLRNIFEGATT